MKILVVNVGSSSIKYQLFNMKNETVICKGLVERIGMTSSILEHNVSCKSSLRKELFVKDHASGIKLILDNLTDSKIGCLNNINEIDGVGHRVVHGGENFSEAIIINETVIKAINDCSEIAPLHNPLNLVGIKASMVMLPNIKHVAVFDTSFHQTMTPEYYLYALPNEAYDKFKIRRYGFHGTSHDYVSHRAASMLNRNYDDLKIISMHLGNGASIAAIKNGKSLDTSMGFTPLEGLVMGTRCGDIDPAIVYYLMDKLKMDARKADDFFNKQSGVLGVSEVSNDLRDIIAEADSGNKKAQCALDIYCLRIKGYIGNYIAKLNGCDCLIFTAGVGENSIRIREKICNDMDFLGIKIDHEKNLIKGKEQDISAPNSKIKVLVIPTNEELVIARETMKLVKQ